MGDMILEWRDGRPIKLGDIAEIQIKRADGANFRAIAVAIIFLWLVLCQDKVRRSQNREGWDPIDHAHLCDVEPIRLLFVPVRLCLCVCVCIVQS